MQCGQADNRHFENGAHGSGASLWTFKLEFGIVHTVNCSVCRSYMTHVAVSNHSGDASFKDALNAREDRVSTAFLDGLQGGRQIQQENDSPVLSRYRDERDKALQDLNDAMKEMAVLRDRILVLELAAQDPVSSKRRNEATSSITESPTKSDMSSVERLLLSPSEDLDALSTPFLSTTDDHDPTLIPNIPTTAEDREALQTETPDPAKPLGSNPSSIEPLGETTVSTESDPQSSALLFKASSSATPEPAKSSPQPSTCALSLPPSSSDQQSSSVEPLRETNVSTSIKSWAKNKTTSSATHKPEMPSSLSSTNALSLSNPSTTDQQSSYVEPPGEATPNVPKPRVQLIKASSPATPEPEEPLPRLSTCALSSSNPTTLDQLSSPIEPTDETNVSSANAPKPSSSATLKPSLQPSVCASSSSNPSASDQQSSSVELPGETNMSTAKTPKSWTPLAKPSSSTTLEPEKSSPQPSASSNTSDQRSSSVEPGETNVSTSSKVPKSWAQLAKASVSATPKPENPPPRLSTCGLSSSNTSDQQSSSVEPPGETNVSTSKVPKSWAQLAKASASATPKPEKPSPRPLASALSLSNPSPLDQQSSSGGLRPLTTITHVEALMKAAHSGDDSSLTRIRTFCGTARRTPRKQRTELQQYALLHWRKPSSSVSSSVTSSVTRSELGTIHTTLGDGMFSTEIHVDSSAWGIGFVMDGLWLAWKFSDSLTLPGNSIDNNWAEMLAVEVGLWTVIHWVCSVIQKEGDVIKSLEIIVCSDNAGVVTAIKKRHSNFPPQQDILLRILDMISKYDIQLSMKWISTTDNLADGPSRGVQGPAPDLLPFIPPLPSYLSDTLLLP